MKLSKILCAGMLAFLASCASVPETKAKASPNNCVSASWYALHGNRTASGQKMNMHAMTAAHRTLPFGTKIHVTNRKNGKSVVVTINDRGPAKYTGRGLDLSKGSAGKIGMVRSGIGKVCYRIIK